MEVVLADVLGYCMGVRRAVEAAEKSSLESLSGKVYSLGPLIHNRSVLDSLSEKGLEILDEDQIESVPENSTVIIRAHGVSPDIYLRLEERGCSIVDATCPRVRASQKSVGKFSSQGYDVVLAGDRNHGEVLGIAGFSEGPFILVESESDAEKLPVAPEGRRAVFLSQTTFSPAEFLKISRVLEKKYCEVRVMNTICPATKVRQDALLDLCGRVDAVVVVGGKNSANTKRLFETARQHRPDSILIEKADEIPETFFSFKKVGVTAGASTPDSDIQEVFDRLKRISQ